MIFIQMVNICLLYTDDLHINGKYMSYTQMTFTQIGSKISFTHIVNMSHTQMTFTDIPNMSNTQITFYSGDLQTKLQYRVMTFTQIENIVSIQMTFTRI